MRKTIFTMTVSLGISMSSFAQILYLPSGSSSIGTTTTGTNPAFVGVGIQGPAFEFQVHNAVSNSNPQLRLSNPQGAVFMAVSGCNGCYSGNIGDGLIGMSSGTGGVNPLRSLLISTNTTVGSGSRIRIGSSGNPGLLTVNDNNTVTIGASTPVISPAPAGGYNFAVAGNTAINGRLVVGDPSGITASTPFPAPYQLYVTGGILTEKVKIGVKTTANWADFVFEKDYSLKSLEEVEAYINKEHHLPDVPAASELVKEGLDTGEMLKLQMQKIEELTLYMIELKKQNDLLQQKVELLSKK